MAKSCFKPCYKRNTFNTVNFTVFSDDTLVLNLVINGIPSIQQSHTWDQSTGRISFKPYYKWNTFNTKTWNGQLF